MKRAHKQKFAYLNMLVISMPTKITFTGNQTLTNLHVNGSVCITPRKLNIDTIITEIRFCINRSMCQCHELARYQKLFSNHFSTWH